MVILHIFSLIHVDIIEQLILYHLFSLIYLKKPQGQNIISMKESHKRNVYQQNKIQSSMF